VAVPDPPGSGGLGVFSDGPISTEPTRERQLTHWVTPKAEAASPSTSAYRASSRLAADDSRMCTARPWIVDGGWMRESAHDRSAVALESFTSV
jgi:hypothetical protein